jgi:hypothetical protein
MVVHVLKANAEKDIVSAFRKEYYVELIAIVQTVRTTLTSHIRYLTLFKDTTY